MLLFRVIVPTRSMIGDSFQGSRNPLAQKYLSNQEHVMFTPFTKEGSSISVHIVIRDTSVCPQFFDGYPCSISNKYWRGTTEIGRSNDCFWNESLSRLSIRRATTRSGRLFRNVACHSALLRNVRKNYSKHGKACRRPFQWHDAPIRYLRYV